MRCTDAQVRRLMEELSKDGRLERAAMKAGMNRKTAAKYAKAGRLPSEQRVPRTWRTRVDPFDGVWCEVAAKLSAAPELEARLLFEDLMAREPGKFDPGQLRTFQRRVRQWRAREGPEKEVYFQQEHRPGEAAQTDFTWATELGIRVGGEAFPHMLCHFVLPYSNWQWATVCHSESMAALKHGIQEAVFRLGRVPTWHQTDNSTSATHKLSRPEGEEQLERDDCSSEGSRGFNEDYLALMRHLGMKARTTKVGAKEQNGDVESLNGALKRRLEQHLLLRGSRDFESVAQYELWLGEALERGNAQRATRVGEELAAMSSLRVERLAEFTTIDVTVTSWSTIRVKRNTYSVSSRLIGERVRVRIFEDRIEVWHGDRHEFSARRLLGKGQRRINYRHVIGSLVRKPGAFERYRYREDLFPSPVFRRGYDRLHESLVPWKADREYLRVLDLAARTMESEVESAILVLLGQEELPLADSVKARVSPQETEVPDLAIPEVELVEYDSLLAEVTRELKEEVA